MGAAILVSGRDGTRLRTLVPPTLAPLGDVDGDRVPDLLIPYATNAVVSGARMFDLR